MKSTFLSRSVPVRALGIALTLVAANSIAGNPVPSANQYLAAKGQNFMQLHAGAAVLATNEPFQAMLNVDPSSPGSVFSVTVHVPGGNIVTLTTNDFDSQWQAKESFSTKSALDAAVPPGDYQFTIIGSDGTHTPILTLTGDTYPNTPHIANWTALQSADASGDILVTWDAFTGGTTNDFVQFRVEDEMGNGYSSGDGPGTPGSLNGTNTSFVIPAGTLMAGSNYSGSVLFARGNFNATGYPGVQGIAAYFKETRFSLSTTSAPPVAGRFRFAQSAYSVSEDGLGIVLTVLRSGGSAASASVLVTTRPGTAAAGVDYGSLSTRILFGEGVESIDLPLIQIVDHSTLDGNKTFFVTLSAPAGGADIGSPSEATVTILDTEVRGVGTFGFSLPVYQVNETASNVVLTVTRTGGATGQVEIVYTTISGSAEAGEDFVASEGSLTFSNGVTSRTITIPIIQDGTDESNETFTVSLFNPTGGAALSAHDTATVVIRDDDTAGSLSFSAPVYSVVEANTNFPIIIRRVGGGADDVSVDLVITGGTATRGEDFDHEDGTTVTLHFGAGQVAVTNIFAIHDDRDAEGDETILLSLRHPEGGARLAGITNATIQILDDEVTLQFSQSNYTNKESAGVAILFVERSGPLNVPAFASVRTTEGSATAFEDYVPTNVIVNFPAGVRKKPVGIRLINDGLVEDPETVGLELHAPSDNALIGPRGSATLHLLSEDSGGVIQFATANLNVSEGHRFVPVTISRTGGVASNVTVHLRTSEMSAHDAEDYIGTNVTLTFAAREVKKTIQIPILSDTIFEGIETFMLHLSNATGGATLGERTDAIVVILDDDVGGVISFARPEIVVNENATNAVVIVNRTGGAASNVRVRLSTSDGTATDPDYASFDEVLTFAAGERSKTNLIRINNDTEAEGALPETIHLSLREFQGGGRPGISNAVIRIIDDESSVSFTNETARATEGKIVTIAVLRAGALNTQVTVDYMTMDGTASAGIDYRATNGTLTFPAHVAVRFINVAVLADSASETNDTFNVILKNPQGGVLLGQNTNVLVTLQDAPDRNAIPITRTPFLLQTTRPGMHTTLTRTFSVHPPTQGHVLSGSRSGGNVTISAVIAGANGQEAMHLGLFGVSGPGVFNVARPNNTADATYTRIAFPNTADSFGFVSTVTGVGSGTITLDAYDGTKATGRYNLTLVDDGDDTKTVHVVGSFSCLISNSAQ
ncbi:MAG: hypothetical protein QOF48_553 [Verrucomicrobiota bacterium]|jgi:hypothetical protein